VQQTGSAGPGGCISFLFGGHPDAPSIAAPRIGIERTTDPTLSKMS